MRDVRVALFVPGDAERMLQRSGSLDVDALIFDLEDAVDPSSKLSARDRVAATLRSPGRAQRWVRVNSADSLWFADDLATVLPAQPDAILLPKADPTSIAVLDRALATFEVENHSPAPPVVALVETARGLLHIAELCATTRRLSGIMLGAEDLTADLGIARTPGGSEISNARQQLVLAARAYGLMAMDTPFLALGDDQALASDCITARGLGFNAKACIHPAQIPVVRASFLPSADERAWAERVVAAAASHNAEARGVFALDGQMIDAPVVARARQILLTSTPPQLLPE